MKKSLIISSLILIVFSSNIFACSCNWDVSEFTAKDYFEYDIIFEGRLDTIYDRGKYKILPFTVYNNYKSANTKIVDVILYGSTCDPTFKIGKIYRIFGNKEAGSFYTVSKCGHTHEIEPTINIEKKDSNDLGSKETTSPNTPSLEKSSDSLSIVFNGKYIRITRKEVLELTNKLSKQQDIQLNLLSKLDSGQVITYFLNGQISAKGSYNHKKPEGKWTFYYPDGRIYETGIYYYGIKNGYWEEYLNPNADFPIRKGYYRGGQLCGKWKWYDKNGKLQQKIKFDKACN